MANKVAGAIGETYIENGPSNNDLDPPSANPNPFRPADLPPPDLAGDGLSRAPADYMIGKRPYT